VDLARGKPKRTVVVVRDEARAAATPQIDALLAADSRVLAVDLFYFGECKIQRRDYLFALLLATVGDRALGVQASQLAAVVRWAGGSSSPVTVNASGPRSAIIALVAANLEPDRVKQLDLHDVKWGLSDVIANNQSFEQAPELFCFGLLQEFDNDRLIQLAGADKVRKD
jgi:pimeloyl-ACP methyl ester carboxylesterase